MATGQSSAGRAAKPFLEVSVRRARDWKRKQARDSDKRKLQFLEGKVNSLQHELSSWQSWWANNQHSLYYFNWGHEDQNWNSKLESKTLPATPLAGSMLPTPSTPPKTLRAEELLQELAIPLQSNDGQKHVGGKAMGQEKNTRNEGVNNEASLSGDWRSLPKQHWLKIHGAFQCAAQGSWLCDGRCQSLNFSVCMCTNLFCSSCMRKLGSCSCEAPIWKNLVCRDCHSYPDVCSCEDPYWESDVNSVGTMEECSVCNRMHDQDDITQCDGKGCDNLLHIACSWKIVEPDGDEAFLCRQCHIDGKSVSGCSPESESQSSKYKPAQSADELMRLLTDERRRREREQQVAQQVAERAVQEAEDQPDDPRKLVFSKAAVQRWREAAAAVAEMMEDNFVSNFLRSTGRI